MYIFHHFLRTSSFFHQVGANAPILRDGTLLPSSFRYTVVYVEYICKYRASASLRRGSDSLAKLEIYLRTQWFVKIEKEICEQFEDILKT